MHFVAEKMRLFWSPLQNLNEDSLRLTLVSGNMRCMWIFAGVRLGGGVKAESGVVDDGNVWRFRWLLLRKLHG